MKMKTLLAASLLVPGLALADVSHTAHTHMQPRTMQTEYASMMEGPYVKVEAGILMPQKLKFSAINSKQVSAKGKNSFTVGFGGGYMFNEFTRADLMLNYRDVRTKTFGRAKVWSAMVNGYVDGHNSTIFTPFALAGVGLGYLQPKPAAGGFSAQFPAPVTVKGKDTTHFMWNVGAGVAAKVDENMCVDVTYRYLNAGKVKVNIANEGSVTSKHIRANEVVLGLGYKF